MNVDKKQSRVNINMRTSYEKKCQKNIPIEKKVKITNQ